MRASYAELQETRNILGGRMLGRTEINRKLFNISRKMKDDVSKASPKIMVKDCRRVMRGEASLWPMVARTTTIRLISNSRLLNMIESNLSSMLREKTCL